MKIIAYAPALVLALIAAAAAQKPEPARVGRVVLAEGGVSVRSSAGGEPRPLTADGDLIRREEIVATDASGRVQVEFLDDSVFTLGPDTSLSVDEYVYDPSTRQGRMTVSVSTGIFRLVSGRIAKSGEQNARVKLPMAEIGVFGTEVLGELRTDRNIVVLRSGRISVENKAGRVVIDRPNQVTVVFAGEAPVPAFAVPRAKLEMIGKALDIGTGRPADRDDWAYEFKRDARSEVAQGMSKDATQAAAAVEARRAEYQDGKVMIDAFGEVVRLEEYVLRPAADQFKYVVLNDRAGSLNYFYYQARFNQDLPPSLVPALRYVGGKTGSAPEFFITAFETGRSNTIDTVLESGSGGHLVNAPLAEDRSVYDPGANAFDTVAAGTPFWSTLFNDYSHKINGTEKFGWQPAVGATDLAAYDYTAAGFHTRILGGGAACGAAGCATSGPVTCTSASCENAARSSATTRPDGASSPRQRVTIDYAADGTSETYESFVFDAGGRRATAADFDGATAGSFYKNTLLRFDFEQTISASEFSGRGIDLVVEPKILVQSGVIQ